VLDTGFCPRCSAPGSLAHHLPAVPGTHGKKKTLMHLIHQNAIICIYSSKTLLKSLQKHCQTVFSRFLSMVIFIPAENIQHSEKPGQNPVDTGNVQVIIVVFLSSLMTSLSQFAAILYKYKNYIGLLVSLLIHLKFQLQKMSNCNL
jgi:hypothetical protein